MTNDVPSVAKGCQRVGFLLAVYSVLLFVVLVHVTTHALSPMALWLNLIPVVFILLGLSVAYGGNPQGAALVCNATMVACLLKSLYLLLALPWALTMLMAKHLFFESAAFYLINFFILWLFYWRLSAYATTKPFWRRSPWRGGLLVLLLGGLLLLYQLSLAWSSYPTALAVPASNLAKFFQGQSVKFIKTRVGIKGREGEVPLVQVCGISFSDSHVKALRLSWVPISAEAYDELTQQASAGDSEAQFTLGMAFFASMGISSDLQQGLHWITRSAQQGNPKAQAALAIAYINGIPGRANITKGYYLLKQASDNGNEEAKRLLARINI